MPENTFVDVSLTQQQDFRFQIAFGGGVPAITGEALRPGSAFQSSVPSTRAAAPPCLRNSATLATAIRPLSAISTAS